MLIDFDQFLMPALLSQCLQNGLQVASCTNVKKPVIIDDDFSTDDGGSNHNNDGDGDGNGNDENEHTQLPVTGPICSKPPAPLPASKRGHGILKEQRPPLGGTQQSSPPIPPLGMHLPMHAAAINTNAQNNHSEQLDTLIQLLLAQQQQLNDPPPLPPPAPQPPPPPPPVEQPCPVLAQHSDERTPHIEYAHPGEHAHLMPSLHALHSSLQKASASAQHAVTHASVMEQVRARIELEELEDAHRRQLDEMHRRAMVRARVRYEMSHYHK